MAEVDDMELLARYTGESSEEAFATLVDRHINLVYSAALRHVNNPDQAAEITQAVFIILVKKAKQLPPQTVLSGWLYHTARLTAANHLRGELRRRHREQEAYMQSTLNDESPEANWRELGPLLDEAMSQLGQTDRDALVLRYFNNKNLKEVGAALGMEERAAQKRVARGVEKLRAFFSRKGVMLSVTAIAGAVSANSVQAAPIGLATTVVATAAKGSAVAASTLTLVKGALKIMAWTKTKTAVVTAVAVLLAGGAATVVVKSVQSAMTPEIAGTWLGTINLPGYGVEQGEIPKTRLVLRIANRDGRYVATGDNIDQGARGLDVNNFSYKHPAIHGEVAGVYTFDGQLNPTATEVSGTLKSQQGPSQKLVFTRTTELPTFPEALASADYAPRAGSALQGHWEGDIVDGKNRVHIVIRINEQADGTFRSDFYCPNDKADRQPTTVDYDGTIVKIAPMAGYGMFKGKLGNGNTELVGDWLQGGGHSPTKLVRRKN